MPEHEVRRNMERGESLDKYKDVEGNWKFWTIERATYDQRNAYFALMDLIRESDLLWRVGENEALRYLEFNQWSVSEAFMHLKSKNTDFHSFGFPFEADDTIRKI